MDGFVWRPWDERRDKEGRTMSKDLKLEEPLGKVIVVTSGAVGAGCQVLGAVRAPPVSSSPRISSFHPPLVLRGALARGGACRASAKITLRETSGFANAEKATTKRRFRFRSRLGVASAFSRPRPRNADASSTHLFCPRPPTNRHALRTNARE